MSTRRRLTTLSLCLIALALTALACVVPGLSPEPTPTLFVIPTLAPTADLGAVAEEVVEGVSGVSSQPYFDPCNLVTQQEAEAALGVPVQKEMFGIALAFGSCAYDSQDFTQQVSVGALYGEDAKGLLSLAIAFGMMSEDPAVQAAATALMERYNTMSVADVLTEVQTNPAWRGEDTPASEPVSGIGDAAFWTWTAAESKGELSVGQGEHYLIVVVKGPTDPAVSRAAAETLARTALTRLPTTPYSTLNMPTPTPTP